MLSPSAAELVLPSLAMAFERPEALLSVMRPLGSDIGSQTFGASLHQASRAGASAVASPASLPVRVVVNGYGPESPGVAPFDCLSEGFPRRRDSRRQRVIV